jgi:hypothetical protein
MKDEAKKPTWDEAASWQDKWAGDEEESDNDGADDVLFSQNPISGVVECYTREGQFIGTIETTGDFLEPPKPIPDDLGEDVDPIDLDLIESVFEEPEEPEDVWDEERLGYLYRQLEETYSDTPKIWNKETLKEFYEKLSLRYELQRMKETEKKYQ